MSIETVSVKEDGVITLSNEKETKEPVLAVEVEAEEEEQAEESEELSDDGEQESEEVQEEVKPKKKGGFQKKLERKDREIEALRQQLADKSIQTEQKEPVSFDKKKPVIDDFNSHAEFTEALADWKYEQKDAEKKAQSKAVEAVESVKNSIQNYHSKLSEFKKSTPDLDDVLEDVSHIRLSGALQEAIITSDVAAEVTYELARNPEEFERINKLSPLMVAKEIGKLELKLSKTAEDKKAAIEAEKNKTTKAPAPLKSLSGKAQTVVAKNINDMTFKEYANYMDAKERKAQKRA